MSYKITDVLLGNYQLSPYQKKIRQDFLNFLRSKKPNSSLTWLDPIIWVREIWAPIADKRYLVIGVLPFRVKSEIHQTLHLIYGSMSPENRLKKDTYPRFISSYKGLGLFNRFPNYGFISFPDEIPVDDYGRVLAKKLFEKIGWRYEKYPLAGRFGIPPTPPVWAENLIYSLIDPSPVGKDLGIVYPDPEKNKNIKSFVNPHGAIEFYIPNKYYNTIKNWLCEKKQKKECIVKICKEWEHRVFHGPYPTSCKRISYELGIREVCIPKPAAFEFFNTILDEFLKKYPQYKNEINGWFKALLAIDYADNVKVPFKKDFENYIKKRAKEIISSFINFYAKPELTRKTERRIEYKIAEYKAPLTFNKVFFDFVDSNPSKYLLALYYLFDLGAYSYFNIFFRLVGQPAWIKAQTLHVAYVYSSGNIGKNFYHFDFIYPGEYLAFYAKIAGLSRKEFIQKEIPSYLELTSKIAKLKKEVEPLEIQVSNLYKTHTGKEYVFPLPALGSFWWQRYEAFLVKEKKELPQMIKEIQTHGKELETVRPEVEKLKKEFVKEAEELNKLYGKKVIDVAKVLPPTVSTFSITKQIEYYNNLKNELIKSIKMIKEKKNEMKTTLERLKKETEAKKKKVFELEDKLATITGKKITNISKLILPEPEIYPEKVAYYQKLNEQLSQIEQVLRKELEKASQIKAKEEFKAIMPILPIFVLGGLMLLQSSQKASE